MELNIQQASIVAGVLIANIGVLIGSYVSLRVQQAVMSEKVGRLERDVQNLADMIRKKREE